VKVGAGGCPAGEVVGVPSGLPRKIAEVDTPGPFQPFVPSTYLDFSPDGRFLVASDGWSDGSQSHLVLISVETGDKVALTSPGATTLGDFSPRFSYDGRRVAFARLRRLAAADLYVLDLTDEMRPAGLSTKIASHDLWNAFPVWTPDNRHLIFAGGLFGSARMKLVRVSGTYRTDLHLIDAGISMIDVQPSKRSGSSRVVYTRFTRELSWCLRYSAAAATSSEATFAGSRQPRRRRASGARSARSRRPGRQRPRRRGRCALARSTSRARPGKSRSRRRRANALAAPSHRCRQLVGDHVADGLAILVALGADVADQR
jgi:dipeptidyl aminopeptidase/acylaminoacyl peptidase